MKQLLIIVLLFSTAQTFAQNNDRFTRKGFVFGLGVGGGIIHVQDHNTEASFEKTAGAISLPNLKIGFMLSEKTALLATFPGAIYQYEGRDRSFEAFIPSIQHWFSDSWWVNGGAGLAMDFPAFYDMKGLENRDFNFGYAFAASSGIELVQSRNYTLDLQAKVQYGKTYLENDGHRNGTIFTLGVGFNWY